MPYKNKEDWKKHHIAYREKRNKRRREYYSKNKEKMGEEKRKYYILLSPQKKEQTKKRIKKWVRDNPKKRKATLKKYRLRHIKEIKKSNRKYHQTPEGKKCRQKDAAKRRNFGFISLNSWFPGSEGHHVSYNYVIYIPKKLHRSVWHSLNSNINMKEINKKAFKFLRDCKKKELEYERKNG